MSCLRIVSLVMLLLASATGCQQPSSKTQGEIVSSSENAQLSGKVIVTRDDAGATVSRVYRVYLINMARGTSQLLMLADKTDGVTATWTASGIEILMPCGRIFEFTNFGDLLDKSGNLKARVEVVLPRTPLCK